MFKSFFRKFTEISATTYLLKSVLNNLFKILICISSIEINNNDTSIFPISTIELVFHQKGRTCWHYWNSLQQVTKWIVKYSAGYTADHWCNKGHIIYCLEGEMETELLDGSKFILSKCMSYQLGDNNDAHRTSTKGGCRLFIVD